MTEYNKYVFESFAINNGYGSFIDFIKNDAKRAKNMGRLSFIEYLEFSNVKLEDIVFEKVLDNLYTDYTLGYCCDHSLSIIKECLNRIKFAIA